MIAQRDGVRNSVFLLVLFSFLLFCANCVFGQTVARVVEKVDNSQRLTLDGNIHPLARAEFDRGAVDDALPMKRMLMLLKRGADQEEALKTLMEQQQDKSSSNYHAWLTPQQFGAQYGPADSDVQAVTQWLQSQGFTIEQVYSGKTVIEFSGNAAQVRTTFGVSIHNYQVNGKLYVANANDPQIPVALAPLVAGLVSLNNFPRQSQVRVAGHARKIAGQLGLQPLFTFPNPSGSGDFYGVGPADFATIYNSKGLIGSGNNGTGQTIAVAGETNINVADVQAFRQMFGLPANFTSSNVILNGEDPGITTSDEETEADLDVQWSGAVAPGATIDFVVSESTSTSAGIDLSALYIIEYNLAGVLSESYGNCEAALGSAGNAFYNSLWEQAAAQGITAILSAGDGGSAGCDDFNTATVAAQGLAVNGLASTPYNVAMGGTDFDEVNKWGTYWSATNNSTTGESALSYIPEIPWNQNCAQISLTGCGPSAPQGSLNIIAGSGGYSTFYSKPEWQMGVTGMPKDGHRDLPDLSLFASSGFDGSGYIICPGTGQETGASQCNSTPGVYNFGIVGGTSASAPAFAGIMALVNQYQSTHGGTARQGNANYTLYPLSKKLGAICTSSATEAATCIFNDVTKGNSGLPTGKPGVGTNSVPCQGGTPNCSLTVASDNGVLVEPTSATTEAWTATAGYDLTTGLGSVNVNNLATEWGTVNTVATKTTLTLSPTTGITHGTDENVTVNITVTPTTGTATGDVSLIATLVGPNGSTTQGLDQFTLNSNGKVVNGTTNSLPGGTNYQVYAHYAGDGTNAPSDSASVAVTVGKETSQTFIVIPTYNPGGSETSGNATSVTYGSNYIIQMYVTDKNATASASGPPSPACFQENSLTCPSGTVTITDNGNALGTGGGGAGIYNLNNGGYTQKLTPNLTGGTHSLVAGYSGDSSYASSSSTVSLTITQATTSMTQQTLTTTKAVVGVPFYDVVAVYSPALVGAAPTGTVTFYDGTTQIGNPVPIQGNPAGYEPLFSVTGGLTLTSAGTHTIKAQFSGDLNYAPSSNSTSIAVLNATSCSVTASPSTIVYGSSITLTGIVDTTVPASNTALKPTGTVGISGGLDAATVTSSPAQPDANGNWELLVTATATPKGIESYSLVYPGDNNYAYCSATGNTVTVNIPDFSLSPASITVVPVAGQSATAQFTITPLTQTPSTVTLSFSEQPLIPGYNITLSPLQVSLNGAPVTATVIAEPSSTNPANIRRGRIRRASFLPIEPVDWWTLSLATGLGALYLFGVPKRRQRFRTALGLAAASLLFLMLGCGGGGGSSTGGSSSGGGGSGSGNPQPTTIALITSNAKTPSSTPVTITATVTDTNSPTGSVTFNANGSTIGQIPLTNGQAEISYAFPGVGVYQVTASYSGDSKNQPSNSSPLEEVVTGTMPFTVVAGTGSDIHILQGTVGLQ
jgi:Pro-kumamolisin, activation domain/Bacterial Ig-like domain (group 3)